MSGAAAPPGNSGPGSRRREHLIAAIVRAISKGHATLVDQLERALLSSFLNVAEAASKTGADRTNRFRIAKGSASEAAAAIEATVILGLAAKPQADRVTYLLARLCAMLTGLTRK